jgi:preprotein translocase subunit SecG
LEILVWSAHVLFAIILIILVLLQHGKGADMGAAFGSGSAGSLFGASGSANFLSRATSFVAAIFFATSMSLTYFSANQTKDASVMSVMDQLEESGEVSNDADKAKSGHEVVVPDVDGKLKADQIPE